jgi:hypothetical protein
MKEKIIEILKNNETLTECKEYFLVKRKDYEKVANEIEEAINYTQCCEEVCDCEFERIDSKRIQCIKCEMVQSRDS